MEPGLYIVGTPIGNMRDITLRAIDVLREVNVILAEDTRHSRNLLVAHGISTALVSCHKFNEASRRAEVLDRIQRQGQAVAMVTDAGMPVISDPGSRLVRACREAGVHIEVIPGPSALTAGIALAGLGERGFHFEGFLPVKSAARLRRLAVLLGREEDLVFYESPHRIQKLLEELASLVPLRKVLVARELTKKFEELFEGTAAGLAEQCRGKRLRGEFVVFVPAGEWGGPAASDAQIDTV